MQIDPASLDQVIKGQNGRMILVEADVGNVAVQLKELDPSFVLSVSESQGHFVVSQQFPKGDGSYEEHLVLTAQECDQRIVDRVREIMHPGYDLGAEMEKQDAAAEKAHNDKLEEIVGEHG